MEYPGIIPDGNTDTQTTLPPLYEQTFFARNHEGLAELFDIVGLPKEAASSIDAAVGHTQPWVKGDHASPVHQLDISPKHTERLQELYAGFGQYDEVLLPPGHYPGVILLGGLQPGNRRRLELLRRTLGDPHITVGRLALLGGQRLLNPDIEKDDVEATMQAISEKGIVDPWASVTQQGRDIHSLWETDGIRLAALEHLGPLSLRRLDLQFNNPDPVKGYEFEWQGIATSLIHTLAVKRPIGDPRHTTEACVLDWLQRHQPSLNATIGFIGANPHIERMVRASQTTLQAAGRGDVTLVPAGSAAPRDLGHRYFLGETARSLYEDKRSLQTVA